MDDIKTAWDKIKHIFISALFFSVVFIAFKSSSMPPKIATVVMIPIALLAFLSDPDFWLGMNLAKLALLMTALYIGILLMSFLIWIINVESTGYMLPGILKVIYQCVNIIVALSAVYILREGAVECAFWGAAVFNIWALVSSLQTYGTANIVSDIINTCTTGDQVGFMKGLELNEKTYAMGLFAVYYTIYGGPISKKRRILYAVISNILFFLGFKRIGIVALVAAYVVYTLFRFLKKELVSKLCYTIGIGLAVVCIIYIPLVRYNLFEYIGEQLNINLNNRDALFGIVKDRYDFTPTFIGRGFGYIKEYLDYLKSMHVKYAGAGAHYIHNDILVYYIELGFWGFLGWLGFNCVYVQRYYNKTYGFPIATLYCVLNVYYYVSLSTDNMAADYLVTLTFRVIMFSVAADFFLKRAPEQLDIKKLIIRRRKVKKKSDKFFVGTGNAFRKDKE